VQPGEIGRGDGHQRAYSTTNGKIIRDYDTARQYQTVNGVPARSGLPGNVPLAFEVGK